LRTAWGLRFLSPFPVTEDFRFCPLDPLWCPIPDDRSNLEPSIPLYLLYLHRIFFVATKDGPHPKDAWFLSVRSFCERECYSSSFGVLKLLLRWPSEFLRPNLQRPRWLLKRLFSQCNGRSPLTRFWLSFAFPRSASPDRSPHTFFLKKISSPPLFHRTAKVPI